MKDGTLISPDAVADVVRQVYLGALDAIKAAGPMGAPNGVLFAGMMTIGMSYQTYQSMIDTLIGMKYVRQSNNLLWLTDQGEQALRDQQIVP